MPGRVVSHGAAPMLSNLKDRLKLLATATVVMILIAAFAYGIWLSKSDERKRREEIEAINRRTSEIKGLELSRDIHQFKLGRVTKEHYDAIGDRVLHEEVVKIMGREGEELGRSGSGESETIIVVWKNFDGTNATVTFQNGRVISKSQIGLK
jgi:hypothetical protein